MNYERFLEPYNRDIPARDQARLPEPELLGGLHEWNERFGKALYDFMAGRQPNMTMPELDEYGYYVEATMHKVHKIALSRGGFEGLQLLDDVTKFHSQNFALRYMYTPILNGGEWPSKESRHPVMRLASQVLGINVVSEVLLRDDCVAQYGESILTAPTEGLVDQRGKDPSLLAGVRRRIKNLNGNMHESEVGIGGLYVVRDRPRSTWVAAPRQFENAMPEMRDIEPRMDVDRYTGEKKLVTREVVINHNADFLYVDLEQREVVGAQAKVNASDEDLQVYDKERIVVISGRGDFGSTKAVRPEGKSKYVTVSYPGAIGAHEHQKNVAQPLRRGAREEYREAGIIGRIFENKAKARTVASKYRVDMKKATKIMRDAIDGKLAETRDPS